MPRTPAPLNLTLGCGKLVIADDHLIIAEDMRFTSAATHIQTQIHTDSHKDMEHDNLTDSHKDIVHDNRVRRAHRHRA